MGRFFSAKAIMMVLILVGLLQVIPVGGPAENPPILSEPKWHNHQVRELFMRACANCHSHETNWPWYSYIAPISWLIRHHVHDGRRHFNISLWGKQKKNKGDEAAEELEEGSMPPASYLWLHPEARLSAEDKATLVQGLRATFPKEKQRWVD